MKIKLGEVRRIVKETIHERTLIEAKQTADRILSEKDSFFGNIARKVGFSNPSLDVDDPKFVTKALDKSIGKAAKDAQEFQASALRTTKEINSFHDSIKDMIDKVSSLSDSLGPEKAKFYHDRMIELARDFYKLLRNESDRIDIYLKTLGSNLEDKGIAKQKAYANVSGLKGKKKPVNVDDDTIETTIDVDDPYEVEKLVGKMKPYVDDKTAVLNYDDPEQVRKFLRGKSSVKQRG